MNTYVYMKRDEDRKGLLPFTKEGVPVIRLELEFYSNLHSPWIRLVSWLVKTCFINFIIPVTLEHIRVQDVEEVDEGMDSPGFSEPKCLLQSDIPHVVVVISARDCRPVQQFDIRTFFFSYDIRPRIKGSLIEILHSNKCYAGSSSLIREVRTDQYIPGEIVAEGEL